MAHTPVGIPQPPTPLVTRELAEVGGSVKAQAEPSRRPHLALTDSRLAATIRRTLYANSKPPTTTVSLPVEGDGKISSYDALCLEVQTFETYWRSNLVGKHIVSQ